MQEFLSNYVTPFFGNRLRSQVLNELVCKADILNIEADQYPYKPVEVDLSKVRNKSQMAVRKPQITLEDSITIMPKSSIGPMTKELGVRDRTPSIKTADVK